MFNNFTFELQHAKAKVKEVFVKMHSKHFLFWLS